MMVFHDRYNSLRGTHMKIKISNVAKLLEADILANGITVIAGLNNTGKSTVLRACYVGINTFRNANQKV